MADPLSAAYPMEYLDRGLIAMRTSPTAVSLGWRLLGTDPADTTFHVYRSTAGGPYQRITAVPLSGATWHIDSPPAPGSDLSYRVRPFFSGNPGDFSESASVPASTPLFSHFTIPLDKPADRSDPIVGTYSYAANDASAADLDGDGSYEILLKWEPSNARDNSQSGYTGNVLIDAYRWDGTRLWRIDLGQNIRAGAHYTQFIVYDFDGDGRAELACRTAPGSIDGQGNPVGQVSKWQNAGGPARPAFSVTDDYRNSSGYILQGPEFLTLFDGLTGGELVSTHYIPFRDPDNNNASPGTTRINQVWGDGYGNRIDRFLAGAAYLDGSRPSLVMCRGYYTRTFLAAWDWRNGTLSRRWLFDSATPGNSVFAGQGAHSLSVGDVDGDGRDEIAYGACTIDDNGTGLASTGIGHGDATHLSDMDPTRPGMEMWMVHESPAAYGTHGSALHDPVTGAILFSVNATDDVGRGVAADVDPRTLGYEAWSSRAVLHNIQGNPVSTTRPGSMNFLCWWDGDLLRELLDGTRVSKWDWLANTTNTLLNPAGISSNNSTKATPSLSADLLGDWREEILWRESDNTALRVYSSTIPTTHRLPTLMHDRQYRLAIAWQNVGYNQPPHPSFYLGEGMSTPRRPPITVVAPATAPPPIASRFPAWLAAHGFPADSDPASDPDGDGRSLFHDYAFGTREGMAMTATHSNGIQQLVLPTLRSELDYTLESSDDLTHWTSADTYLGGSPLTLSLSPSAGARFHRLRTVTPGPGFVTRSLSFQAEAASYNGSLDSNHSGFRGTGFINSASNGSFIEWSGIDGGIGGASTLVFRFALGATASRTGRLVINGVASPITFPVTGAWNSWQTLSVPTHLTAGSVNTIRLETTGQDLANLDEMTVTVTATAP